MKQISKVLVIVMAVALFVTGLPGGVVKAVAIDQSVPDSPAGIAFVDGDSQMNHYFGLVPSVGYLMSQVKIFKAMSCIGRMILLF